jgi:hypothetical protein
MTDTDIPLHRQFPGLSSDDEWEFELMLEEHADNPEKLASIYKQIETKAAEIYGRFLKCCDYLDQLPEPLSPEHRIYQNMLERLIDSAENDYMSENCDDFELVVKLMNLYLDSSQEKAMIRRRSKLS